MKFFSTKLSGSLIALILLSTLLHAEGGQADRKNLHKTSAATWPYAYMNINNISTVIFGDGQADINPLRNAGFVYPKGSNKTAVFESGFLWGGIVNNEIRVNGSSYSSGLKPGKILPGGVPEDPKNARVYRVRKDYKTADLSSEISDNEGTESEIRERYDNDWKEWPALDGAPYEDVDHNGVYDPAVDIPGEPGADETIWFAANDLDEAASKSLFGSKPIGIEMQCTVYAFRNPGILRNMIFKRYKLINKSSTTVDKMYTMAWGDFDIGDATDDFEGCDTLLDLGYTYNAVPKDMLYQDTPPAAGFAVLQGPAVKGSLSDTAYLNNRKLPGMMNLPMTSFSNVYVELAWEEPSPIGANEYYRFMQGKQGSIDLFFPVLDQFGGGTTRFPYSGDPVAGTGYLDGILYPKGDRRMGVNSGPFTMAPGDTQEVVLAEIAAGTTPGVSNLQAVTLLKNSTSFAREFYHEGRSGIKSINSPVLTAGEYDKEIVLNWGDDQASVSKTESFDFLSHKFEGYNVYQLPYAGAKISEGKRIAVFDRIDSIKIIYSEVINWDTGAQERLAQQYGKDSGIQRFLRINEDAYTKFPLINGKKYYFAVTAYTYSPNLDFSNMESDPTYVEVIPHTNDPGVVYNSSFGDTLRASHNSGKSDGEVIPIVVEPGKLTGDEYSVEFESTDSLPTWKVVDLTKNKTILSNQTAHSEKDGYPVADGILFKVISHSPGVKTDDAYTTGDSSKWGWRIPAGKRRFTWSGANGLGLEGFRGAIGAGATWLGSSVGYSNLKNVLLKLAATDTSGNASPNDSNVSYAYRYVRAASHDPARPEFAPFIKNKYNGTYGFQDFTRSCPLAAYDFEDPQHPRRLAVGYLENNSSNGLLDGKYWPPEMGTDNTGVTSPREWLFIFDKAYSETEDQSLEGDLLGEKPYPVLLQCTFNRNSNSWPGGDEFEIYVNHIFTPDDKFTFKSIAPSFDGQSAKADVERINVFPNPYYGALLHDVNNIQRLVTFSHLPVKATIRIFNLAGQLVRTIYKDTPGQFASWDLLNEHNLQAASGLYLVHIDMPDLGKTKILKLAIIQEQIVPERF
ncbi:MAG TPA: T9SS type A sorting domain-containing protein [Ignavibacteriales bacterium]|nr:T9SS type A sorting domain-containing protein [Ignavibacteriales bacterium]